MDIQQLSEKFQLNKTEISILNYMMNHKTNLKAMNIRQVAKETFTSPSYIIKMCKKLRLSGYSELVFLMTDTISAQILYSPDKQIKPYIKPFVQLLKKHCHSAIMVLGSGYSQNIANYMSEYLNLHGFRATANSHLEFLRKNADALIIFISNSGETVRINELCQLAAVNQIKIIAFVGNNASALAHKADLTISTNTFSPTSFDKTSPQLFFGLTLIYFEILMSIFLTSTNQDLLVDD
ncbi:MurR/RpiR family transcriptional regulator [Liquorilactobacillus sicerae]|uniref:MurR/RpiR family transcriptional regulator n=1 Tax=Liquorilactobacillus sicerae TaxID=1416943 RepID=UPI00248042EE|nr:SIS domain-containing protein [Liquorilactobacillus sicerae]